MVNMKIKFKTVSIYSSLSSQKVISIISQVEEVLANLGIRVLLSDSLNQKSLNKKKFYGDKYLIRNAELVIAIGGDGTLLSASRLYGFKGIPVLGINLGTIGFLTDIAPEDLTNSLTKILQGKYTEDKRFLLEASVNDRSLVENIALNEIVIHSDSIAQLMEYDLFVDNRFVYRQRADGLILSTPTGSTAYALSGNGPIVHPDVKAITLLPMFPHSLNSRPMLIDENSSITVKVKKNSKCCISFDSHNKFKLKLNDEISITKTSKEITLLHPENHDFFEASREKLGWSLGVPKNYIL